MAWTLPTPCTQPGCSELVRGGGRCHRHAEPRPEAPGGRVYDLARWDKIRIQVIREERFCRACLKKGIEELGREVDHIIPVERGGAAFARQNLQLLCHTCHSRKTLAENESRRPGGR